MKTVVIVLLALAGCWLLDRLGGRLERRGWIYWRKSRGYDGRLSQAFAEVHSLLEPDKRHIRQIQEKEVHEQAVDASGDDPAVRNER
ncbi:MAG: hypothetical protein JXQ27_04520 [Acidobacteria bacterium]|nr:hypothetical protein [Acidobacteriota bacterium]